MNKFAKISLVASLAIAGLSASAQAADTLADAFANGKLSGAVKVYHFAQSFDGAGKNDSKLTTAGGHLTYVTDEVRGLSFGATLQTSNVLKKDDIDGKTKTTLDSQGAVLSESYINYKISNTNFKLGRQFVKTPLVAGSGSRLIKEAFEAYMVTNTDLPDTTISLAKITKYQQRTDFTTTSPYTSANPNASGGVGTFMKIGEDGIDTIYIKNNSISNLTTQLQYAVADKIADLLYIDAVYKFDGDLKPFVAAQYFDTDWDAAASKDASMYGLKIGVNVAGVSLFAGYNSTNGESGDAGVARGLGQGAYSNYTATTKTAGAGAFAAGTDSYQVGAAYNFNKAFKTKLRYSSFDNPTANADLDETTLNLEYKFGGALKNLKAQIDYSILDYENNTNDATDLRSRLIYSF